MEPIFRLSLDHWVAALASFVPALLNLFILIYVFKFRLRNASTLSFILALLALFLLQLQETLLRLSADEPSARFWLNFFGVPANLVTPFALHFVLMFINKKFSKSYGMMAFFYVPTLILGAFQISDPGAEKMIYNPSWGWSHVPSDFLGKANALWLSAIAIAIPIRLAIFAVGVKHTDEVRYKQASLMFFGTIIPVVIGVIYEILLPVFIDSTPVPITSALTLIFVICMIIAVSRYGMLDFSPETMWASIIKNINDGIIITDNSEVIKYVNEKICAATGYAEGEMIGKKASDLLLKDDNQRMLMQERLKKRKEMISDTYELPVATKSGKTIWWEIRGIPYIDLDGNITGSIGLHTDITEKKRMEKQLRQSFEVMNNIFHSLDKDTFWSRDMISGRFVYISPGVEKLFQRKASEFYSDLDFLGIKMVHPDDIEIVNEKLRMVDYGREETLEYRIIMPNESVKWIRAHIVGIMENNRLVRRDGSMYDITEQRQLQEKLNEKVKDMNMFIYRASHDLRGPLSSILGLTTIGKLESNGNVRMDFYFDKIAFSIRRLDNIIQELSQIGRIIQVPVKLEKVDIKKETLDVIESLRGLENYPKIKFDVKIDLPFFNTDKVFFIMTLQNLIANSINYMDSKKNRPYINIHAAPNNGNVKFVIEDNGVGIDKLIQNKVFEMFYRGSDLSKGSGLGLYIVKNTIQKLGGNICFESEAGKGSVFSFQLPKNENIISQSPLP